jgi:septal ring factor EnvC (AmiA/AmiB activator)
VLAPDARTATFRKGIAWEAPVGTPVYAVAAGRVRYAGRFRGYGNVVILDHGSDHFTVSAHLDRIDVALGDPVAAGTAIGAVGETGSLEGPQLYFEIRRGSEALDPAGWLAARNR